VHEHGLVEHGFMSPHSPDGEIHFGEDFIPLEDCMGDTELPDQLIDVPLGRQVVFLNFDGALLTAGGNSSKDNKTMLLSGVSSHQFPAMNWGNYGGKEKGMAEVVKQVKILFYKYGVTFVTTRPTSGDYTMVMIGGVGTNIKKGGPGTVGISPLDCKNSNKNDVLVVFGNKVSSIKSVSFVIAHELGHSFGLEHIDNKKGIMYPALQSATEGWAKGNVSGSTCGRSEQDADKVLTDNLGVGDLDKVAPLIWLMYPGDGAVLPPRFHIRVGAADDFSLAGVTIYVDGTKKLSLTTPPFVALVEGLSEGKHTIKAEAQDLKPNKSSAEVKIKVDKACVKAGDCDYGKGGLGMPCGIGGDCSTEICATKSGTGYCAVLCSKESKLCPSGMTCQDAGGEYACVPGAGFSLNKEGTGCAVGGGARGVSGLVIALLGLLFLRRRRSL